MKEEIGEFAAEAKDFVGKDETPEDVKRRMEAEMGDLLFSLINAARLYGIQPENALERTNKKFISRFGYIEEQAKEMGKSVKELTLGEMEELWQKAKKVRKQ